MPVCDFCGASFEWTPAEWALDAQLKLSPFCEGLGAMCDACGDKEVALAIAEMEREERDAS